MPQKTLNLVNATQMSEHSLKLNFCMFEESQGKHNNLECHKVFGIFFIVENFTCSKFNINQIFFLAYSNHSNLKSGQSLFFSNMHIWFKSAFDLEYYGL
jgi:hypothetical protein